jgi:D-aspartate ligase
VYGIDFKKDIAYYSRFVNPLIGPHPLNDQVDFILWLKKRFSGYKFKIPIFVTSDDYLMAISSNREQLNDIFSFNFMPHETIRSISDKYQQFVMANQAMINVPKTWIINDTKNLQEIKDNTSWPLLLKGLDVNTWRAVFGGTTKGFVCNNFNEVSQKAILALENNVSVILQEIITGPDTNHFKYCAYIDSKGKIIAEIGLQKIRQLPVRFGVGTVVKSVDYPELFITGRKFFERINYLGVGSAEFKIDEADGVLKLIELNPRYWQQNAIGEKSGVNFAYINYLDLMNLETPNAIKPSFGTLWINRYMDFSSFMQYRKEGLLTFSEWRKSLKGKKVYSDFSWDDPLPFFYEFGFGLKFLRLPIYLWKIIKR